MTSRPGEIRAKDMAHGTFGRSMLETKFRAQVAAERFVLARIALDLCCSRPKAAPPIHGGVHALSLHVRALQFAPHQHGHQGIQSSQV